MKGKTTEFGDVTDTDDIVTGKLFVVVSLQETEISCCWKSEVVVVGSVSAMGVVGIAMASGGRGAVMLLSKVLEHISVCL